MTIARRFQNVLAWILSLPLGLLFVVVGAMKLITPEVGAKFQEWGYPEGFHVLVGAAEITAGVLLVVPAATFWAAGALAVVMVGAVCTHLINDPPQMATGAGVILLLLLVLLYLRRPGARVAAYLEAVNSQSAVPSTPSR